MAKVLRIQHIEDGSGPFSSVDSTQIPQPLDTKKAEKSLLRNTP